MENFSLFLSMAGSFLLGTIADVVSHSILEFGVNSSRFFYLYKVSTLKSPVTMMGFPLDLFFFSLVASNTLLLFILYILRLNSDTI